MLNKLLISRVKLVGYCTENENENQHGHMGGGHTIKKQKTVKSNDAKPVDVYSHSFSSRIKLFLKNQNQVNLRAIKMTQILILKIL